MDSIKKNRWGKVFLIGLGGVGIFILLILGAYLLYTLNFRSYSEIQYANVTPNSATVVWVSRTPETGAALAFEGEAPNYVVGRFGDGIIGYDDRDYADAELDAALRNERAAEKKGEDVDASDLAVDVRVQNFGFYYVHHVTFKDLKPNTTYKVLLGDGYVFKSNNNEKELLFTTHTQPNEIALLPSPAYGAVKDEAYQIHTDGVVKMSIIDEVGETISDTIVAPLSRDGTWYLDLNSLHASDGTPFFEVYNQIDFNNMNEVIDVITKDGTFRQYLTPDEDSPAPDIFILESNKETDDGTLGLSSLVFSTMACEDGAFCGGCINSCVGWGEFDGASGCSQLVKRRCNDEPPAPEPSENPVSDPPPAQEPTPSSNDNSGGGRCPGQVYCSGCGCVDYQTITDAGASGCTEYIQKTNCNVSSEPAPEAPTEPAAPIVPDPIAVPPEPVVPEPVAPEIVEPDPAEPEATSNIGFCCIKEDYTDYSWTTEGTWCPASSYGGEMTESECYKLYNSLRPAPPPPEIETGTVCCKNKGSGQYEIVENVPIDHCAKRTGADWTRVILGPGKSCGESEPTAPEKDATVAKQFPIPPVVKIIPVQAQESSESAECTPAFARSHNGTCDRTDCSEDTTPVRHDEADITFSDEYNTQTESVVWKYYYTCTLNPTPLPPLPDESGPRTECTEAWAQDRQGVCSPSECGEGTEAKKRTDYATDNSVYDIITYYQCVKGSKPSNDGVSYSDLGECNTNCTDTDFWDASCAWDASNLTFVKNVEKESADYNKYCKDNNEYVCSAVSGSEYVVKSKGFKCQYSQKSAYIIEEPKRNLFSGLFDTLGSLLFGVNAQSDDDQHSITFSPDNKSYLFEQDGRYLFFYEDKLYEALLTDGTGNYLIYIDDNGNSVFDVDVDTVVEEDPVDLQISRTSSATSYDISPGFNYISFDFIRENGGLMASELLSDLNNSFENYDEPFYSLSTYDSGKWKIIGSREGQTYGADDFQVVPGRGYLLRSKYDVTLDLAGYRIEDPVPVSMMGGWNLVAVHGSTNDYTAEQWIDSIDKVPALDADNVTRWDSTRGKYDGLQKSEGEVYGFDFPIYDQRAYFVRIVNGTGRWTPE